MSNPTDSIQIPCGMDTSIPFQWTDGSGNTLDITGWTVLFTAKQGFGTGDANDMDAVISKNITSHTDPTNGLTSIPIARADTWNYGNQSDPMLYCDIVGVDGSGAYHWGGSFTLIIQPVITRRSKP